MGKFVAERYYKRLGVSDYLKLFPVWNVFRYMYTNFKELNKKSYVYHFFKEVKAEKNKTFSGK